MATNLIFQAPQTAFNFTESGGSATWTPKNVANGAGRVSARLDRGSGALPMRVKWEATFKAQANVNTGVGARFYIYCFQVANTAADYVADAAVTAETQFLNFTQLGQVLASTTAAGPFYASGFIEVYGQYIVVGVWNATGQTFTNVDGETKLTFTPMPDQIQGAV